jgi:Ca2+-dependent lipid-binding protein
VVADPYVKACVLVGGSKKAKKKKTATVHNSNCPVWNEALVFSVSRDQLEAISLELCVFHDNMLGNDERLGKVRLASDSTGQFRIG